MNAIVQSLSHLTTDDERGSAAPSAAGTGTRSDQDPSSTMDRLLSDENIVRNILEQLVPLNHISFVGTRVGKWRIKGARAALNGLEGELISVESYAASRSVAEINDDISQGRVPFLVTLPNGQQRRLIIESRYLEPAFSRPAALRAEVVASRPWLEESRCVCKVWRLAAARPLSGRRTDG